MLTVDGIEFLPQVLQIFDLPFDLSSCCRFSKWSTRGSQFAAWNICAHGGKLWRPFAPGGWKSRTSVQCVCRQHHGENGKKMTGKPCDYFGPLTNAKAANLNCIDNKGPVPLIVKSGNQQCREGHKSKIYGRGRSNRPMPLTQCRTVAIAGRSIVRNCWLD